MSIFMSLKSLPDDMLALEGRSDSRSVSWRDSELLGHIIIWDVGLLQAFSDITAAHLKACKIHG